MTTTAPARTRRGTVEERIRILDAEIGRVVDDLAFAMPGPRLVAAEVISAGDRLRDAGRARARMEAELLLTTPDRELGRAIDDAALGRKQIADVFADVRILSVDDLFAALAHWLDRADAGPFTLAELEAARDARKAAHVRPEEDEPGVELTADEIRAAIVAYEAIARSNRELDWPTFVDEASGEWRQDVIFEIAEVAEQLYPAANREHVLDVITPAAEAWISTLILSDVPR